MISLLEILEKPYYNIAMVLMAHKGTPEPLYDYYGERQAFLIYKEFREWENFFRNQSIGEIAIAENGLLANCHMQVACAITLKIKQLEFFRCKTGGADFGEPFLEKSNFKQEIIDFYRKIPDIFELIASEAS